MDKERKLLFLVAIPFLIGLLLGIFIQDAIGESYDTTTMYVSTRLLNGRAEPSKKSTVEARFDKGDALQAYGWSKNHHWIEVDGGETGTVWVWYEYVNEQTSDYSVWWNDYGHKVKIRKEPYGTVIGYLKAGKEVTITQIILGWGKCDKGWIDLRYLSEED
jgi:uncharacterized protein YgiM (DUF1202 family)